MKSIKTLQVDLVGVKENPRSSAGSKGCVSGVWIIQMSL